MINGSRPVLCAVAAAVAMGMASHADAQPPGLPALVRSLLVGPQDAGQGWDDLDRIKGTAWGAGPVALSHPTPDGNELARPGAAVIEGRKVELAASGARAGVFSIYVRDAAPPRDLDAIADDFRRQGFTVARARCRIAPAAGPELRGWLKLSVPGRHTAYLQAGPLASGLQGYTLFLNDLPPMTQAEAQRFTDSCGGATGGPATAASSSSSAPRTGQAFAVEAIQAVLRAPGAPTTIPWTALPSAAGLAWNPPPPMKMKSPYDDGGADPNPRLLEGHVKTATTAMTAIATGTDQGANHFSLMNAEHMPHDAVLAGLRQAGFTLAALRCGKVYTQQSEVWFRISGPGRQPAILYRAQYGGSHPTETYVIRLDNLMPAMLPGQSAPVGGACPG